MSDVDEMEDGLGDVPSTRSVVRWLAWSILLGALGAIAGLVFLGVIGFGDDWYGSTGLGWFEGNSWWIAVATMAGVLVGFLRRAFRMPAKVPGLIEDLRQEHVEPRLVPSIVAVSAVSLLGGASLGPEVALGQMGGGAGEVIGRRARLDPDEAKPLTLGGMAGAFGGLFSSPLMAIVLVMEVARVPRRRFQRTFYTNLVSSSTAFGLYFVIAGTVFLGIYDVPSYEYEDWHLLAGLGFGVLAALITIVTVSTGSMVAKLFERVPGPDLVKPAVGGLIFGVIGFALPLTNFTGSEQLATVLENAASLGSGLLLAILAGKILAFAASSASGFIGGPIFPIIFLGGTSGVLIHEIIPDIPLGLAFTCMLAAVPGAAVAAPLSMVLLAALLTQIGAIQTAPILIAVGTAYITIVAVQSVRRSASSEHAGPAEQGSAGDR
jgi:H+/Cl- antiporter ClcA